MVVRIQNSFKTINQRKERKEDLTVIELTVEISRLLLRPFQGERREFIFTDLRLTQVVEELLE